MLEINISNVYKSFNLKKVFQGFNLEVNTNDKIALIGSNGTGKSTLFKIIMKQENVDSGYVTIRSGSTIKLLEQIPEYDDSVLVKDVLTKEYKFLYDIEKEMHELELEMSTNPDNLDKLLKRYSKIQDIFIKNDGYNLEDRVLDLCMEYNIDIDYLDRSFNKLSGGEKTVVLLASIMAVKPDVLLLDEPTNHLDIKHLEWLENFINNYEGTIIISSHDRYFLDKVVNKICLIEGGKEELFFGNYSYYIKEKEHRLMKEFQDFKDQEKLINAMKEKIKRLQEYGRRAAPEGGMFFKRAANIQKRLDKIEVLDKPSTKKDIPINFEISNRSGNKVIELNRVRIGYYPESYTDYLLNNADMLLRHKERVCLMGENGTGKSTLIKAIIENKNILRGTITLGSNVKIGYIPQEIKFDNNELTVFEYSKKFYEGSDTILRSILAKFYFFEEDIDKKVKNLSGGEKVRLKLFELIEKKANLLILDEPTNHIDIDTKELLEDALLEYSGTLLFVSHDRYFINKIATRILNIEEFKLKEYLGNYDFFKEHKKNI